jgi:hypothetical protein
VNGSRSNENGICEASGFSRSTTGRFPLPATRRKGARIKEQTRHTHNSSSRGASRPVLMSHAPMQRATSEQQARISSRTVVSPATGRTLAAALLSLRADGPIVGGLYTPGEPLLLVVAAALHDDTEEH